MLDFFSRNKIPRFEGSFYYGINYSALQGWMNFGFFLYTVNFQYFQIITIGLHGYVELLKEV